MHASGEVLVAALTQEAFGSYAVRSTAEPYVQRMTGVPIGWSTDWDAGPGIVRIGACRSLSSGRNRHLHGPCPTICISPLRFLVKRDRRFRTMRLVLEMDTGKGLDSRLLFYTGNRESAIGGSERNVVFVVPRLEYEMQVPRDLNLVVPIKGNGLITAMCV